MKVEFWLVGKSKDSWITGAIDHYAKRCGHYCTLSTEVIPESRFQRREEIMKDETQRIDVKLEKSTRAFTILLSEYGSQLTSERFAQLIDRQQTAGHSTFRFIIGGAFGVEPSLHDRVDQVMALSAMTFPHQLVRVIFLEQLYRAFTILRGENYHH